MYVETRYIRVSIEKALFGNKQGLFFDLLIRFRRKNPSVVGTFSGFPGIAEKFIMNVDFLAERGADGFYRVFHLPQPHFHDADAEEMTFAIVCHNAAIDFFLKVVDFLQGKKAYLVNAGSNRTHDAMAFRRHFNVIDKQFEILFFAVDYGRVYGNAQRALCPR